MNVSIVYLSSKNTQKQQKKLFSAVAGWDETLHSAEWYKSQKIKAVENVWQNFVTLFPCEKLYRVHPIHFGVQNQGHQLSSRS